MRPFTKHARSDGYFEMGKLTVGTVKPRPSVGWRHVTKHARDDGNPDYLAADLGEPLRTPGELFSVYLMDEMTREPMPVVELPEVE